MMQELSRSVYRFAQRLIPTRGNGVLERPLQELFEGRRHWFATSSLLFLRQNLWRICLAAVICGFMRFIGFPTAAKVLMTLSYLAALIACIATALERGPVARVMDRLEYDLRRVQIAPYQARVRRLLSGTGVATRRLGEILTIEHREGIRKNSGVASEAIRAADRKRSTTLLSMHAAFVNEVGSIPVNCDCFDPGEPYDYTRVFDARACHVGHAPSGRFNECLEEIFLLLEQYRDAAGRHRPPWGMRTLFHSSHLLMARPDAHQLAEEEVIRAGLVKAVEELQASCERAEATEWAVKRIDRSRLTAEVD